MQIQRWAVCGLVATGTLVLSHLSVNAGPNAPVQAVGQSVAVQGIAVTPVADPPPVPRERSEPPVVWRERAERPRRSLREYLFRHRRFGGRRYNGPPTAFSQTYYDDQTANGFDYGGRCARTSYMCERQWGFPNAKYDGCMQEYGCRAR